ncbi:Concanavalin A-like lectin/glucanase, subgroup [Artemisia annua]|uniref:Concanavalin A-like lectin/glucanase, subgroup n=1 Tax=Artemisia annua TaxID=35608 RepID=A0A2U1Q7Y1_ARTAN|nr:Concanavalin A-like lectin/glucanase, subgroup [Artemisia annua]
MAKMAKKHTYTATPFALINNQFCDTPLNKFSTDKLRTSQKNQHEKYSSEEFTGELSKTLSLTDDEGNVCTSSVSSTCSDQSNLQTELEKLRLELRDAVIMYNQACDELVHTQTKDQNRVQRINKC